MKHIKKFGGFNPSLRVECVNRSCKWSWLLKDGGKSPLLCHKCGGEGVVKLIF